jgi:hypothetical protein
MQRMKYSKWRVIIKGLPVAIFALLILLPSVVFAGRIAAFYGMGNDSCGELIEAFSQRSPSQAMELNGVQWPSKSRTYVEWTLGYITAFNMVNGQGKNLDNADLYGVAAWIQKWCGDHPMDSVSFAAWHLIIERTGYKPDRDKDKQR